jgi:hypothetical protein
MPLKKQALAAWILVTAVSALIVVQALLPWPGSAKSPTVEELLVRVAALETKLACVTTTETTLGAVPAWDVYFTRCNVHIRNGAGVTGGAGNVNGFGNLIVGYNEDRTPATDRGGSHNVVVGDQHEYPSWGGLVAGFHNTISGPSASVAGGTQNTAYAYHSSVSGGINNTAGDVSDATHVTGSSASVSGGSGCAVSGGDDWGAIPSGGAIGDC